MLDPNQPLKKRGVLRSWHEDRGFGVVRVGPPSSLEKYFLHVSKIISGTGSPTAGMEVLFLVSPTPATEGKLRAAVEAEIILQSVPASDGGGR
jgi:hypothetical protein